VYDIMRVRKCTYDVCMSERDMIMSIHGIFIWCVYMYIYICIYINFQFHYAYFLFMSVSIHGMGWLRLVGSLKL